MYINEETKKKAAREMRVFKLSDWFIGLLAGASLAYAATRLCLLFGLFNELKTEWFDLTDLGAKFFFFIAFAALSLLSMTVCRVHRDKKMESAARAKSLERTEALRKSALH